MRLFKCILLIALPLLLFVNIWRLTNMGDEYTYQGVSSAVSYVSTYQGFKLTYSVWTSITTNVANMSDNADAAEVLRGLFSLLTAPISIPTAIISDIVYNIVFFFGWIFSDLGNSKDPIFGQQPQYSSLPSWNESITPILPSH